MFNQFINFQAHLQTGKLTALCVSGPQCIVQLPNVRTVAEAGLPGYEVSSWFGFMTPRGTSQHVVARLNAEVLKVLSTRDVQEGLRAQGFETSGSTPEQFSALIASESVKGLHAIKESGAKLD